MNVVPELFGGDSTGLLIAGDRAQRQRALKEQPVLGHSRFEKTKTHKRIISIASRKFREEGLAGVGIAKLMKEAGLTVGGFYKHFDSRDDLVAEAVSSAFGGRKLRVDAAKTASRSVSFAKLIDDYLSEAHRERIPPKINCN